MTATLETLDLTAAPDETPLARIRDTPRTPNAANSFVSKADDAE
jgi:hypothetical protein